MGALSSSGAYLSNLQQQQSVNEIASPNAYLYCVFKCLFAYKETIFRFIQLLLGNWYKLFNFAAHNNAYV